MQQDVRDKVYFLGNNVDFIGEWSSTRRGGGGRSVPLPRRRRRTADDYLVGT